MVGHLTSPSLKYKNVQCGERLHSDFFACRDLCLSNGFLHILEGLVSKKLVGSPSNGKGGGTSCKSGETLGMATYVDH